MCDSELTGCLMWIFQLLPFFLAAGKNPSRAVALIQNHYKFKKESPEFFKNRDVNSTEIQNSLNNQKFAILPTTPDKHNLIIFGLSSYEPSDYDFNNSAKTYIMSFGKCYSDNWRQFFCFFNIQQLKTETSPHS